MVGDCVGAVPTAERGEELADDHRLSDRRIRARTGPIVGEVSSVDQQATPAARITGAEYWPLSAQCALNAIGYTGSIPPVVDQGAGRPGMLWTPSMSIDYLPVGPNAAQRALGQHWSACIVGTPDGTPYVGRLRQVLAGGALPAVFGSCWPTTNLRSARQIPATSRIPSNCSAARC